MEKPDLPASRVAELHAALRFVETHLAAEVEAESLLGLSAAVVHGGELLWSGGFGRLDREHGAPVRPDTVFRVASITKLVTATAVMRLRDAGKLRLDDPLVQHIPEFQVRVPFDECPPIVLRHLLSHVSGLQREPYLDHWVTLRAASIEEMLRHLRDQELLFPPLTEVHYSNLAFGLLGEVIRRVTGGSYADYARETILDPSACGTVGSTRRRTKRRAWHRGTSAPTTRARCRNGRSEDSGQPVGSTRPPRTSRSS